MEIAVIIGAVGVAIGTYVFIASRHDTQGLIAPPVMAALLALPDSALAPAERRARDLLAAAPDEAARATALDELGRRVHCLELLA